MGESLLSVDYQLGYITSFGLTYIMCRFEASTNPAGKNNQGTYIALIWVFLCKCAKGATFCFSWAQKARKFSCSPMGTNGAKFCFHVRKWRKKNLDLSKWRWKWRENMFFCHERIFVQKCAKGACKIKLFFVALFPKKRFGFCVKKLKKSKWKV